MREGAFEQARPKTLSETTEYRLAADAVRQESVTNFLESVRGMESVEDALVLVPGTNAGMLEAFLKPEERAQVAARADEKKSEWRSTIEAIRNARDMDEARKVLGDRAREVGTPSGLEILAKMKEQKDGGD